MLEGLRWQENGQSVLSGPLKRLYDRLDARFVELAGGAEEMLFPPLISARELQRLDYFRNFPHLATFALSLDPDEENLIRFAGGPGVFDGEVALTRTAPVKDALTPAACYHIYIHLQGAALDGRRTFTTRCACFRREKYYQPLRRQWSFGMREIVCVGTMEEVQGFLTEQRARVDALTRELDLQILWQSATDPFFDPRGNPKWLAQKLAPVKTEMVFGGDLAIGSVNFHRNFFGETFGITLRRDGRPAFSGCVAFGLERWIHAVVTRWGIDPARWP